MKAFGFELLANRNGITLYHLINVPTSIAVENAPQSFICIARKWGFRHTDTTASGLRVKVTVFGPIVFGSFTYPQNRGNL